jgi:hypothetical protein
MLLWAIVFADLFGVFFVWIALSGMNLIAIGFDDPLPLLIASSVSLVVITFDLVAFAVCLTRKRTELTFKGNEQTKKRILSELQKYEFFYFLGSKLRKGIKFS